MKKGLVVLLVILAVVILVSPGIIGRIAEESMDQNLELAITDNDDVSISTEGFVRGWFSSAGQHRIEPKPGQQWTVPSGLFDDDRYYVTALVVDTTVDHGLIPVTSMSRENGSLAPGLGSAVSTLGLEFDNGAVTPLPGVIYSKVGLTGELRSNLVVDSGNSEIGGGVIDWSDADVVVTADPASRASSVSGVIESLSMTSPDEIIRIGRIDLDATQEPGPFGFPLGSIDVNMQSVEVDAAFSKFRMGPMRVASRLTARGDRLDGSARLFLDNFESPLGTTKIDIDMRLENADGDALARTIRSFWEAMDQLVAGAAPTNPDADARDLLNAGFELHFDRFNLVLPQGSLESTANILVAESSAANFSRVGTLLALEATLDLQMSQGLVDLATAMEPQFGAVVGLGYLRKEGDVYKTFIEMKSGVVTINGAPMQVPLSAVQ